MTSERVACALLPALLLLGGCEIEKATIPRTEARVSLHGVLSATAPSQVVLLERTRNGSVAIIGPPFELGGPILTDDLVESGALVTLTTPAGETLVAREDNASTGGGSGRGIYRFALPGSALQRLATYRLSVRTASGQLLTAETAVPGGAPAVVPAQRVFDRSRDTVVIDWAPAPGARGYFVRIETPWGPRSFFTDSTRLRLTGDLRNVDVTSLPRVFIPGFPQPITVSAVDSNYYDWYRTHNDRISGRGLVNRVSGGIGVFGSLVRLDFRELQVTAPQTEPEAGIFEFVGTDLERAGTPYLRLELYVESRAARDDQEDAISGRTQRRVGIGEGGCSLCGVIGTARDGRIRLAMLAGWFASDTAEIFTGELRGDTIVGSYRGFGGPVRFVRAR